MQKKSRDSNLFFNFFFSYANTEHFAAIMYIFKMFFVGCAVTMLEIYGIRNECMKTLCYIWLMVREGLKECQTSLPYP